MDEIDIKIVNLLAKNARISIKNISEIVKLSSPAVSTRISRLEEAGYITSYQAELDHEKIGYPIKAYISLAMKPARKPEFYEYVQSIPNVIECCCVTGDYSMMLEVLFDSTHNLDLFVGRLQQFGDTMTQIVFSTAVSHRQMTLKEKEK